MEGTSRKVTIVILIILIIVLAGVGVVIAIRLQQNSAPGSAGAASIVNLDNNTSDDITKASAEFMLFNLPRVSCETLLNPELLQDASGQDLILMNTFEFTDSELLDSDLELSLQFDGSNDYKFIYYPVEVTKWCRYNIVFEGEEAIAASVVWYAHHDIDELGNVVILDAADVERNFIADSIDGSEAEHFFFGENVLDAEACTSVLTRGDLAIKFATITFENPGDCSDLMSENQYIIEGLNESLDTMFITDDLWEDFRENT